jgi:hypothetical protein
MVSAPCRDTSVAEVEPLPRPSQGRESKCPTAHLWPTPAPPRGGENQYPTAYLSCSDGPPVMLGWPVRRPYSPSPALPERGGRRAAKNAVWGGLLHSYILHLTTGRSARADFFGSRVPYYIIYFIISLLLKSEDDKTICKVVRCKVVRTGSTATLKNGMDKK